VRPQTGPGRPSSRPGPSRGPSRGGHGGGQQFRTGGYTVRHVIEPVVPKMTEVAMTPVDQGEPTLRYVPLGGLEEVGRNCSYYEYGNEIVIVDVGIQFPEEHTPGADYIIPNLASIEPKKQNVRGLILTHGHYDHIAAIHYLLEKMGNPIIYASEFTKAMVEKRHEEFTNAPKLRFQVVTGGSTVKISEHFEAEFFHVEHTIPEALGFALKTPAGNMVSFGDFRVELDDKGQPQHLEVFEKYGKDGVHTLFLDATNADFPGFLVSEKLVRENVEMLIKNAHGRIIVASFSSLVDRLIEIITAAQRVGRKVAINGRSMITNIDIAKRLGYLKGKTDHLIRVEDVHKYKDHEVLVLTTGAQGEPNSGFMRITNGEHRFIRLKPTDSVIFSSSVVPGNERSVQTLQDNIARQVDEVYNYKFLDIHASGHGHGGDLQLVLETVKPRFVIPIHAYYYKRKAVIKIAETAGMNAKQVHMVDNGQIVELHEDSVNVTGQKVPTSYVIVDGLGVGDVEEVVLRDRVSLSREGMLVLIITLDRQTGRLVKTPDIISRGFIYLRDNTEIMDEIRKRVRSIITRIPSDKQAESDYIKTLIRDQVGQYLWQKTKRRPMLLPVVIEV
jgi:ribonuclease J